ncbi:alpha/beta fold hydrolase [Nonomuraea sp. NPDC049480]|uniref:alpha/beta fold hydrolase n=1 Tax=Nonomuraea sp. NPDC049480 TaxID=3364353 RepID=UPI0037B3B126
MTDPPRTPAHAIPARLPAAIVKAAATIAGGAAMASILYQILGERADRRRFPPPGKLVNVRGRRIHVWLEGDGDGPTVVVAPGIGSTCLEWTAIQRQLVPRHRVLLYDRGGLGWSDWVPGQRSAPKLADELHAVLEAAAVPGPYVLVGHSLGGSIIRLYAARHPERVAGLILIESTHELSTEKIVEEFGWRMGDYDRWKRAVTRYLLRPRGIERARVRLLGHRYYHDWAAKEVPADLVETSVALDLTSRRRRAVVAELIGNGASSKRAMAAERRHFGDLPLTVITRSPTPIGAYGSHNDPEFLRRWMSFWMPLQQDLAALANNSRHIVTTRAGHSVHLDEPDLVVAPIKDMCEARSATQPHVDTACDAGGPQRTLRNLSGVSL